MGKDKRQRQTTTLDPRSERYLQGQRQAANQAAGVATDHPSPFFLGPDGRSISDQIEPFMDPYMDQVIGGVRGEFDHLRAGATRDANQAATAAGAFNSARHGVLEGTRHGELDRAQTSQIGGLLSQGFNQAVDRGLDYSEYQRALRERQAQEPLFRQTQRMNFLTGGMGPTGSTTETVQPGNFLGDVAGLGLMGLGLATGRGGGGGSGYVPPTVRTGAQRNPALGRNPWMDPNSPMNWRNRLNLPTPALPS